MSHKRFVSPSSLDRAVVRRVAGAPSSGFTTSGLVAQFDASQLALSDNATIGLIPDLSGNALDLNAIPVAASQIGPTFKTAIKNGLGVARFTRTLKTAIQHANSGAPNNVPFKQKDFTFLLARAWSELATVSGTYHGLWSYLDNAGSASDGNLFGQPFDGANSEYLFNNATGYNIVDTVSVGRWDVVACTCSITNNQFRSYRNNVLKAATAYPSSFPFVDPTQFRLGSFYVTSGDGGFGWGSFDFGELLYYNRVLSAGELTGAFNYLSRWL